MITYIDKEGKNNNYTMLFAKASAKLGLAPVDKDTGEVDANGDRITIPCKYVPNGEQC